MIKSHHLHIGGLIALGFSGKYMLAVSHSGRGVYDTSNWEKMARDGDMGHWEGDQVMGIGPLNGKMVKVIEKDYDNDQLTGRDPDGRYGFHYEDGMLEITDLRPTS